MSTREYKGCMSYEQTEKAWNRQRSGAPYATVAMEFCVDISTLYRSYKHYGFAPPRRKQKKEHCSSKSEGGQLIAPLSVENDEGTRDRLQRFV